MYSARNSYMHTHQCIKKLHFSGEAKYQRTTYRRIFKRKIKNCWQIWPFSRQSAAMLANACENRIGQRKNIEYKYLFSQKMAPIACMAYRSQDTPAAVALGRYAFCGHLKSRNMPRGKLLSENEEGEIMPLQHACWTIRGIARHIGRSPNCDRIFLRNPRRASGLKSSGNACKMTRRHHRALIREAFKGNNSARDRKTALSLPVSVRRVQKVLQASPILKYKKMVPGPMMVQPQKGARLQWSKEHLHKTASIWKRVIFLMRKKIQPWRSGWTGMLLAWPPERSAKFFLNGNSVGPP